MTEMERRSLKWTYWNGMKSESQNRFANLGTLFFWTSGDSSWRFPDLNIQFEKDEVSIFYPRNNPSCEEVQSNFQNRMIISHEGLGR
jgi:hypothetical protein